MKSNRMMWILVTLVVFTTIAVSFGTLDSRSQEKVGNQIQSTPTPDNVGYRDMTKYAVADYDEVLPTDAKECQKRKLANGRYDNQHWVIKNPHPDDGGAGLDDEKIPPPIIPAEESDLIVIGTITDVSAHMSNDKRGVYSEFTIRVKQILKNDA